MKNKPILVLYGGPASERILERLGQMRDQTKPYKTKNLPEKTNLDLYK